MLRLCHTITIHDLLVVSDESDVMSNDIFDTKERSKVVAKDILTASELVNHPNFTYTPSKQLRDIMSDEEIATIIMHLKRQGALDTDERRMYFGGRIQAYPGYDIRTNKFSLNRIANSPKQEAPAQPNINTALERIFNQPEQQAYSADKIIFDTKASVLIFGSKTCDIPDESLEHYVCKFAFKNRKVAAKEIDILDAAGIGQDSQRAAYDAHLRVNKKAKDQLHIKKLLNYKAAKIRIDKNYI